MKFVGLALILVWAVGLMLMVFGRGRARVYINKRNALLAGGVGILGGVAWVIGDPARTWWENVGKIAWMSVATAFLFWVHGKEHLEKIEERKRKWMFDLPDKTIGRLQVIGLAGGLLGGFVVGPAYELFWEDWEDSARAIWAVSAIVVGLMVFGPITILLTRRRRRPPHADDV